MFGPKHIYRKEAGEGDDGGGETVVEETKTDEVEEDPAVVAEATRMGWNPKAQFRGDPDKWRPAAEFLERGRSMLPIVTATVKKQATKIAELEATMKQMGDYFTKTQERANANALASLKSERAKAIAAGDGEAVNKVDDAIDDLKKDIDKPKAKAAPDADPVYDKWAEENARWLSDEDMEEYGTFISHRMRQKGEKATGREFLDLVTKAVKTKFPEKFENPRRAAASSVEGTQAPRKGGKGYADLPSEARAACDRMAKNAFPDKPDQQKKFRDDYVKEYDWS